MKKVFNGVNFGMEKYLRETKMLDYSSKNIQRLIQERNWNDIEVFERLKSIYNFVRDEILFGYNMMIIFLHQKFWQMVMGNAIQKELCSWHY